jgi:hypothetical protein
VHVRLIGRVDLQQALDLRPAGLVARIWRIVAELRVLHQVPDDVDAEAVDAAPEPEAQRLVHRLPDLRVAPIEVRLLGQEGVVVGLAGRLVEGPGRSAEIADPVVRRRAVGLAIAPDVPVALRALARRSALLEPGMAVGGVVRDEVEDHLQPLAVRLGDQAVEVGKIAEERIDVAIIGDVVAEIGHRRGIDR